MRYLLLVLLLLAKSAIANELDAPEGAVLLTISGNIEFTNSERGAEFDLEMLELLGATSIVTDTPWTDPETKFTGVRLDVLLNAVGARSTSVRASALDTYWYDISDVDLTKYPVVVAYKQNDKYMSARQLGPLWIMFPFNDFPELLNHANKASCVWQLDSLFVK